MDFWRAFLSWSHAKNPPAIFNSHSSEQLKGEVNTPGGFCEWLQEGAPESPFLVSKMVFPTFAISGLCRGGQPVRNPNFLGKCWEEASMVTFGELSGLLVHTDFAMKTRHQGIGPYGLPLKFIWTNGSPISLKVLVYTWENLKGGSQTGA